MPAADPRHQRRAAAARARSEARAHAARPRPVLIASAAALLVIGLAAGVWLLASGPSAAPPVPGSADLTPTPGVAGPTAVVVTNSPWQVLIARGVVRDMTSPSDVAVDAAGNLWVADFEGEFVQKFSPGGQPLDRIGQKGNAPGQFAGPSGVAVDGQGGEPLAVWGIVTGANTPRPARSRARQRAWRHRRRSRRRALRRRHAQRKNPKAETMIAPTGPLCN